MSVKRVHPRKGLRAPLAGVRSVIRVELLVSLAVVLPRKTLPAAGPVTLEGLLFIVRSKMT
jgi:hypothetical protein